MCPRPIAWVYTRGAAGHTNLAPFSFFNVVSVTPPVLGFSPLLGDEGQPKDTIRNLEAVGESVVHIGGEAPAEALNATSASLPYIGSYKAVGAGCRDRAGFQGLVASRRHAKPALAGRVLFSFT